MTHNEINNLTVEGNEILLMMRIIDLDNLPDGEEIYSFPEGEEPSYNNLILNSVFGTKPTNKDLQDELVIYKAELTTEENARLEELSRINDLNNRFNKLFDKRLAMPEISNPDAYFRDMILKEVDKNLAESRMAAIEAIDSSEKTKAQNELNNKPMKDLREARDKILSKTDFSQLADAPFTSEEKIQYRNYRAFLRDLPNKIDLDQWLEYRVPSFEEFKDL